MPSTLRAFRFATLVMVRVFFIGTLVSMSVANGAEQWVSSKIVAVYALGNGDFVLTFLNDNAACTNANTPKKYYYVSAGQNGVTDEGRKSLLATATAAAASKADVFVAFDDSSSSCFINRIFAELGE